MKSKKTARNSGFLFDEGKKKLGELLNNEFPSKIVVEVRRIELLSENRLPRLSTSVADVLTFPRKHAQRQACFFSSLYYMIGVKAAIQTRSLLIDALIRAAVLSNRTSST